jgi:predicted P-loop ATPase
MGLFDYFSNKVWRHAEDVDTRKEQDSLLLERLKQVELDLKQMKTGREPVKEQAKGSTPTSKNHYEERQQAMLRPVHDMAQFVMENFEFRHNIVRDLYEYRRKGDSDGWKLVDNRQMNSINCRIQDDGEIFCLSSYVRQRVESDLAVDYHPVREYLSKVRGQWDGATDYIGDFARRISQSDYCQRMVRIWLRAVVAQWLGVGGHHANSVMLLLVSQQQGLGKSTFFASMLPKEIADYYTDDFNLKAKGNAYRKMVEFALVSLDEFEKIGHKKMPELKSMMQTTKPSFIGAYKKNFNHLPRIASFVGTTNERHVLTDRTGSRRFLVLEPDGFINAEDISHDQLYAQLLHEVEEQHLPHWFTKEEEAEMERHNKEYYVLDAVERLFLQYFTIPEQEDEGVFMSGAEMIRELSKHSKKTMEHVTTNSFGRSMTRLGVKRVGRHDTDGYIVGIRDEE